MARARVAGETLAVVREMEAAGDLVTVKALARRMGLEYKAAQVRLRTLRRSGQVTAVVPHRVPVSVETLAVVRDLEAAGELVTVGTLARRLGIEYKAAQARLSTLRRSGDVPRVPRDGTAPATPPSGLARRLEALRAATSRLGRKLHEDELSRILGDGP